MPDKYLNFASLAATEREGAFSIFVRDAGTPVAVAAPHGGEIELGTSEIARAVAADDLSYYVFEGAKAQGNGDLHITSANFDEPRCLCLLRAAYTVVTVHGEDSEHEVVYLGGRDRTTLASLRRTLPNYGFTAREHSNPKLQGLHPNNICNIGRSGAGVQLELSRGLRRSFFVSLFGAGRAQGTYLLARFTEAVRQALPHNGL
jgi:phage replication-related protein YjqB (UPF0714/DUF867 family)